MASSDIQDVKRRIKSVTGMEHITNAMKLVSAAKLRKAKAIFEKSNANTRFVTASIAEVFNNATEIPSEYIEGDREIVKTAYIIVTSCRGLCGGFNSAVIKEAEREMLSDPEPPIVVAVGTKGRDYFAKRGYEIVLDYEAPPEDVSFLVVKEMCQPILEMYRKKEIDEIILIYTSYISPLEMKVKNTTILPIRVNKSPEIIRHKKEVEYEPSIEAVFNYLVPKYIEMSVFGAIVESATCEHAARRMAMENATDNAREMLDELSLFYNRARQATITNEIIEIVAGSEAQG